VKIQEIDNPQIIVKAKGLHKLDASVLKISRGRKERIVVEVVIRIGLNLKEEATRILSFKENVLLDLFIASTRIIALFTTIPVRNINPIKTPIPTGCFSK